jgi:hypothetical protein
MAAHLRWSLAVFATGFAVEAILDVYRLTARMSLAVSSGTLFLISAGATVLALLFLGLGQHEWNELHRSRVLRAHAAFLLVLVLSAVAVGSVAYALYRPGALPAPWLALEVGVMVAGARIMIFVTYTLVVFHLVGTVGKSLLGLSALAAVPVAYDVGRLVETRVGVYLAPVPTSASIPSTLVQGLVDPLLALLVWLFVSDGLPLAAYVDAHHRVVRQTRRQDLQRLAVSPRPR